MGGEQGGGLTPVAPQFWKYSRANPSLLVVCFTLLGLSERGYEKGQGSLPG